MKFIVAIYSSMIKLRFYFFCLISTTWLYVHVAEASIYTQQASVVAAGGTRSASVSYSQQSSTGEINGIIEDNTGELIAEIGYLGKIVKFTFLERPSIVVAQSAIDVDSTSFVARWKPALDAENYRLEVSLNEEFSSFVLGYADADAGPATQFLVDNLIYGETYYYRVTAENGDGLSEAPSNVIKVLISDNTPFVKWTNLTQAVLSVGSVDSIDLLELFNGTGMIYSFEIVDSSLISCEIVGTLLTVNVGQELGSVDVILGAATPSGFKVEHTIRFEVIVAPSIIAGELFFNRQNGLYEQSVVVANESMLSSTLSVKLTVSGLTDTESLYNATREDLNGKALVEWDVVLEPQSSIDFLLQYQTTNRSVTPTPSMVVQLSFEEPLVYFSGKSFSVDIRAKNLNGSMATLLEFPTTIGEAYYIQYKNSMSEDWKIVLPGIVAGANRIQWIDAGPPATDIAPGKPGAEMRFYRAIKVE